MALSLSAVAASRSHSSLPPARGARGGATRAETHAKLYDFYAGHLGSSDCEWGTRPTSSTACLKIYQLALLQLDPAVHPRGQFGIMGGHQRRQACASHQIHQRGKDLI